VAAETGAASLQIGSKPVPRLVDTHYHLDHAADPDRVIEYLERERIYCIAVTLRPGDFALTQVLSQGHRYVRPALGYHPVYVTGAAGPLDEFKDHLAETRYIGEVGLDYTPDANASPATQRRIFSAIIDACASDPRRVLTVHSRRAADDVVSAVNGFPGTVILHWFSGSPMVLERAVAAGCYFSINAAMVRSARGRELVARIPDSRLLTETDGPFVQSRGREAEPQDVADVIRAVARIREHRYSVVASRVYQNFASIVRCAAGRWSPPLDSDVE
jgi:TatD DNase family protein